jgi:peptidyl-prolyl cis-trans isomerase C
MLKYSKIAVLSMLCAIVSTTAYAETKSVATVNGVGIPQARFDMRMKAATAQGRPDTPELRNSIRNELVNLEILAQAATKKGLNKNEEVKQQQAFVAQEYELAKQSILVRAFMQDFAKNNPLSDDALKQEFDRVIKLRGNKEYKVAHIVVKTEEEAKAVVTQLKNSKFEDVAMDKSLDQGTKVQGGDLGWIIPGTFAEQLKPLGDAIMALSKGSTSAPVQSKNGWHIFKLEDTRDLKVPSFDEAKNTMAQEILIQKAITEQRANAKIK